MTAVADDACRTEGAGGQELEEHRRAVCPNDTGERRARRPASEVIVMAAWLALVTGFAEGLYWLAKSEILGSLVFMHPGFLWMSPLAQLALFLLAGVLLAVVARLRRGREGLTFSVTLLALLGWLNLLALAPGLHFWAWILASCGLAAATGRLFRRHEAQCLRAARRSVPWLGACVVVVATAQAIAVSRREATALASLPPADEAAPNVLLIVLDTVRADALRLHGADREVAPNLRALAEQGVVFEQAWSTSPWTMPSQAGMFTGRLPHALSADWLSALDGAQPTLAEELSRRGWLAAGFVGNTRYCSRETGLARGFAHYEDYRLSPADVALCTTLGRKLLLGPLPVGLGLYDWPGRKPAGEVSDEFLRWLERHPRRPFFAFLNYWDAHDPYIPAPGFQDGKPASRDEALLVRNWWWLPKEHLPDDRVAMLHRAYEDCIRGLDWHIGQLLCRLRSRGELENTLIVVTSDHGEHFAEHGLFLHGNSLYEPLLHVPLIVVWPGKVPAGTRVRTPVSLSGLPNTIMELVGQSRPFPGESWVQHWKAAGDASRPSGPIAAEIATQAEYPPCHGRSPVASGPMQCVRQGDIKYIRSGDGTEEVYDLAGDPLELRNLADSPSHAAAVARLRRVLTQVAQPAGKR